MTRALELLMVLMTLGHAVNAETVPIGPADGETYYVGETCRTSWEVEGAAWTSVKVELMAELDKPILTIVDDLDTRGSQVLSFECLDVTQYSQIYFFRYTNNDNKETRTTGRFTIAKRTISKSHTIAMTYPVNWTMTSVLSGGQTTTFGYGSGNLVGAARGTRTAAATANDYSTGKAALNPTGKYQGNAKQASSRSSASAVASQTVQEDSIDDIAHAAAAITRPVNMAAASLLVLLCLWIVALA